MHQQKQFMKMNVYKENEKPTCPTGKVCFKSQAEVKRYIAVRNALNGGKGFKYHFCKECGYWHLTTHTVCGDHMLKKKADHYDRLKKKSIDRSIFKLCGLAA